MNPNTQTVFLHKRHGIVPVGAVNKIGFYASSSIGQVQCLPCHRMIAVQRLLWACNPDISMEAEDPSIKSRAQIYIHARREALFINLRGLHGLSELVNQKLHRLSLTDEINISGSVSAEHLKCPFQVVRKVGIIRYCRALLLEHDAVFPNTIHAKILYGLFVLVKSYDIVIISIPDQCIGAHKIELSIVPENPFLISIVVRILEANLTFFFNCLVDHFCVF